MKQLAGEAHDHASFHSRVHTGGKAEAGHDVLNGTSLRCTHRTSAHRHERSTDSIQKASLLNARRRDRTRPVPSAA